MIDDSCAVIQHINRFDVCSFLLCIFVPEDLFEKSVINGSI